MRLLSAALCLVAGLLSPFASAQAHPRDFEAPDDDTRAWWHTTEALSADTMEGRDTGTAAYQRAADYVAHRFQLAGLQPAGDHGTWFQTVPMHQVDLTPQGTRFTVQRADGQQLPLAFLQEVTAVPPSFPFRSNADRNRSATTHISGPLTFRGYCGAEAMSDITGKVVVCFGTQRQGLPTAAQRTANARHGHAAALLTVDDPYFTLEPPRWPYAYARSVTLASTTPHAPAPPPHAAGPHADDAHEPILLRLSDAAFTRLLAGTSHDAASILKTGGAREPLTSFDLDARLNATLQTTEKDITSPNVLAVLPGSDPVLASQYVVVAAHLDGYGFGTAVDGDTLYNGTLDDAAYVALLIQLADDLRDGRERRITEKAGINTGTYRGTTLQAPKRSILFCAFTGEEKGLLGSTWFIAHPTVPLASMAADINLDQLRPLFPLKILTALALHETTLGDTAAQVATLDHIQLREDREPERGLLHRADHYPFLKAGIPSIGFIFGFDPGTDEERRYRHWYEVQYHRPQDDLTQPVDFHAALQFNIFFYHLVETVAGLPKRPQILPGVHF